MLADGLSLGEFMTYGGDDECCAWAMRGPRVVAVIQQMLEKLDLVAVIENDHFHSILAQLGPTVGGLHMIDAKKLAASPAYKFSKPNPDVTFESECGRFAPAIAAMYGAAPTDVYRVDDGLSFYYKRDKLAPADDSENGDVTAGHVTFLQDFRIKATGQVISFAAAHLSSGDALKNERLRVQSLADLKDASASTAKVVVLMDSNYSRHYSVECDPSADDVIEQAGWVSAVPEDGNECFKMRHAQGGQPKKFGDLMFDGIDKILVKGHKSCKQIKLSLAAFKSSLPNAIDQQQIMAIRTNPVRREELKEACVKGGWGQDNSEIPASDVEGVVPLGLLQQLYPNAAAPSDHPPVAASISFADPGARFGRSTCVCRTLGLGPGACSLM